MKTGPDFSHSHTNESSSTMIRLQAVQERWGRSRLASAKPANPNISEQ